MRKKLIPSFLFIIFLALLNSCIVAGINGNGKVIDEDRNVKDFNGVYLEGVGEVNIYQADNFKVTVTTDSNIQDIITTKVSDNVLIIDEEHRGGFNSTKLIINVYMPELSNITLKGAGNFNVVNGKTSNLEITLKGAGNIKAQDYEVENVTINHSGAGDIKLWATKSLTGKLSGVGNIFYKGSPSNININRTGIGNLNKL